MSLVESGAPPDPEDANGETPLQLACRNGDVDVAAALARKGADATRGFESVDRESTISRLLTKNVSVASLAPLLGVTKDRAPNCTYLSVFLERIQLAPSNAGDWATEPLLEFSVLDGRREAVEPPQAVVCPCLKRDTFEWWGATIHVQHPIENLPDNAKALFHLFDRAVDNKGKSTKVSIAWCTLEISIANLQTGPKGLEMFKAPVDVFFAKPVSPAGAFLSVDVNC